jgi:hypothetical protein
MWDHPHCELFDRTNRGHIDEYMNADIPGGTDYDGGGGGREDPLLFILLIQEWGR